jgi:hypothetical protein
MSDNRSGCNDDIQATEVIDHSRRHIGRRVEIRQVHCQVQALVVRLLAGVQVHHGHTGSKTQKGLYHGATDVASTSGDQDDAIG